VEFPVHSFSVSSGQHNKEDTDTPHNNNTPKIIKTYQRRNVIATPIKSHHLVASSQSSAATATATVYLGVRLIWVHPSHQRQQIGHQLVEQARNSFLYGYLFSSQSIAFTQLTYEGFQFAKKYYGDASQQVICYEYGGCAE